MPTYEYRCPNGHKFDRFAKMSESAAELSCPECGELAVRQLSGGAGLVFKGSGFYLTDYGKNAHRAGGGETVAAAEKKSGDSGGGDKGGDKGGDMGGDKGGESKSSDSKPDSKPAEKSSESKSANKPSAAPSTPSSTSSSSSPKTDK
jgi:putative FmdB family regulatory protein